MYSFSSRVRFSEVDCTQKITLHAILNYFQDCSIFHASHVHLTIDEMMKQEIAWVLASWQIVVDRYPRLEESITVSTWAYGFKGFYGYRNFTLTDADGNVCAYANTIWTFLDIRKMHPKKIPTDVQEAYEFFPPYPMENAPRKITFPDESTPAGQVRVTASQTDVYRHVNNAIYVQLAQEYLPEDFDILQMRAEYIRAAVEGDVMHISLAQSGDCFYVTFRDENGDIYSIIEFKRRSIC